MGHSYRRLHPSDRPEAVTIVISAEAQIAAAEHELRSHAQRDRDRCWGYFPALSGRSAIHCDLPACQELARAVPAIESGVRFEFNFMRLALVGQSSRPAFHLDTDAATALTGNIETLHRRRIGRLLLNLSSTTRRVLHYLDLDPGTAPLTHDGSYVHLNGTPPSHCGRQLVIPPRRGGTVHGLSFVSNRVLHSGVDGNAGHFIAAYGYEGTESADHEDPTFSDDGPVLAQVPPVIPGL